MISAFEHIRMLDATVFQLPDSFATDYQGSGGSSNYQGLKTDLRTSLDMVSSFMGIVTEHPDYQECLNAINEKRKPEFE